MLKPRSILKKTKNKTSINYNFLLAPIMESIAGKKISEIFKEKIIAPLQLKQTFMFDEMYNMMSKKMIELQTKQSQENLIAMRNELEKIAENFSEKSKKI